MYTAVPGRALDYCWVSDIRSLGMGLTSLGRLFSFKSIKHTCWRVQYKHAHTDRSLLMVTHWIFLSGNLLSSATNWPQGHWTAKSNYMQLSSVSYTKEKSFIWPEEEEGKLKKMGYTLLAMISSLVGLSVCGVSVWPVSACICLTSCHV